MARPRKEFNRLSRTITARLLDDQYDWLVDKAIDGEHGDLSKALREAVEQARIMEKLLQSADPLEAFRAMLERSEQAALAEEFGET
jgi:arginine deiminase